MTDFLLFTIYAPLASWGEIAVGEARSGWDRPSRSAVLGFVAAAIGVVREDVAGHTALRDGYGVAVRVDALGVPLSDYHTAQTASASVVKRRRPVSRAELLAGKDLETTLSRRTYRQDALSTIAIWERSSAPWSFEKIAGALRHPTFALYAGRKANVLGLPADPELISAATLAGAFAQRTWARAKHAGLPLGRLVMAQNTEVSHDACLGFSAGLRPLRRETRRDVPMDRVRWQFTERNVEVGMLSGAVVADQEAGVGA